MKKVINGLLYNTDTAKEIGVLDNRSVFNRKIEALYRKRTGEYFLYEKNNRYELITPFETDEAVEWIEEHVSKKDTGDGE